MNNNQTTDIPRAEAHEKCGGLISVPSCPYCHKTHLHHGYAARDNNHPRRANCDRGDYYLVFILVKVQQ
ncbi:hypothetical protein ISS03_02715 [Patescibacteria group bacterium]|nr:hypothetical protein [Patescibacteria group bacterium]